MTKYYFLRSVRADFRFLLRVLQISKLRGHSPGDCRWEQRGLIELRAYDGQFKDWKSSYEYTPESAVFIINHGLVRIDLRARGKDHAKLLAKRPMGFVASV